MVLLQDEFVDLFSLRILGREEAGSRGVLG